MSKINWSRRSVMLGAAALPMIRMVSAKPGPPAVVISSANRFDGGVNCCAKAMELIKAGADTLDAVVAGVNIVELDPRDSSVGYGGLPNEDGVVQLDSSVVHGPSRRMGAVGAIEGIKTPSKVAKRVMEDTDHMMLVGAGALKFAKAEGFQEENLLTEESRLQWLVWKRSQRDRDGHSNWGPGLDAPPEPPKTANLEELKREFPWASDELLLEAIQNAYHPPHGTINCIALNEKGEMSAVTTTSGLAWKISGRVGDSPIVGGGLWLDQDVGGAGSTGRGEENLRVCGAHTVVENMRRGMAPKEAVLDALERVARNFNQDRKRLEAIDLKFYALRKDGEYAGASLWNKSSVEAKQVAQFAVCTTDGGSRQENAVFLYARSS
ncbi:MAG: N(4)-(beta-N-acetylglucosaminyl)-L-asparaginase [Bryobacteraceae bacterium]|jgi:N4-(beta-N-acetylglucosaminyl)-L-asparaginase